MEFLYNVASIFANYIKEYASAIVLTI